MSTTALTILTGVYAGFLAMVFMVAIFGVHVLTDLLLNSFHERQAKDDTTDTTTVTGA